MAKRVKMLVEEAANQLQTIMLVAGRLRSERPVDAAYLERAALRLKDIMTVLLNWREIKAACEQEVEEFDDEAGDAVE